MGGGVKGVPGFPVCSLKMVRFPDFSTLVFRVTVLRIVPGPGDICNKILPVSVLSVRNLPVYGLHETTRGWKQHNYIHLGFDILQKYFLLV